MARDKNHFEMTEERERHLARVIERITELTRTKYRVGQSEHGGDVFKRRLIGDVLEETIDLGVYVVTLEEQIEEARALAGVALAGDMEHAKALRKIRALL